LNRISCLAAYTLETRGRVPSRSLCMDALPSIDCADWGRPPPFFPVPPHRFTWRAVRAEPQPSLCQDVPGSVLVPVERGPTGLAAEEPMPIRRSAGAPSTRRASRRRPPGCHVKRQGCLPTSPCIRSASGARGSSRSSSGSDNSFLARSPSGIAS
jgi:hypothetical protein